MFYFGCWETGFLATLLRPSFIIRICHKIWYYRITSWRIVTEPDLYLYDSCHNNQFNRGKMWKRIDSITMSWYNLHIPINSIMLLSPYEPTQSIQMNDSNDSIRSINRLNIYVDIFWNPSISLTFLENVRSRWHFLGYFEWIQLIQWQSIDSVTYFTKTNWLSLQSNHLEKWLNQFNQFRRKMNRFKSINSVELFGIQVCFGFSLGIDTPGYLTLNKWLLDKNGRKDRAITFLFSSRLASSSCHSTSYNTAIPFFFPCPPVLIGVE